MLFVDSGGRPQKLLINGGTSNKIILFSSVKFILNRCSLPVQLGGCRLKKPLPSTILLTCLVCKLVVHKFCDQLVNNIKEYKCPIFRKKKNK